MNLYQDISIGAEPAESTSRVKKVLKHFNLLTPYIGEDIRMNLVA
jgi:hypothetical protein